MTSTIEQRETTVRMAAGIMESSHAVQAAGVYLLSYGLVLNGHVVPVIDQ
jgi:hypothetical protein